MPATSKPRPAAETPPADAPEETPSTPEPAVYGSFAEALSAFQLHLPRVSKGQTADVRSDKGSYSYDYADLTDVSGVVLPALAAVGLSWSTGLDTDDAGKIWVNWELMHGASGEGRHGRLPAGQSGANWQNLGSAITYARRYALTAATGVAPGGDDDDAQAATAGDRPNANGAPRPSAPPQSPVQTQPERLPAGLYDLASLTDVEAVREMFRKARAVGHLPLLIGVPDAAGEITEVPFGQYLTDLGQTLTPAPGEVPDEAAEEAAVAAAIAEHEAELAAATEARDDDDAGDRQ